MSKNMRVIEAKQARFDGDFQIEVLQGAKPTDFDIVLKQSTETCLDALANEHAQDKASSLAPDQLIENQKLRQRRAATLRQELERILILGGSQFSVDVANGTGDEKDFRINLLLKIKGTPDPQNPIADEKQRLFIELSQACNVVGAVCQRASVPSLASFRSKSHKQKVHARAMRLLEEYTIKLCGIGRVGLVGSHVGLAQESLNQFKEEVVVREGGRVKNAYVRVLGFWSAALSLAFLGAWIGVQHSASAWLIMHGSFLLAAMGAAIGTWISFSVRRVQLTFHELLLLEEHSLDPPLRVIFVVGLTMVACLLFWTGALNIAIGSLNTEPHTFINAGSTALLIGLLAGLSERGLATAISGRSAAFVKGVGAGG